MEAALQEVKTASRKHANDVYPIYKFFCERQQGQQTFVEWYPEVYEQAKMYDFTESAAEPSARNAITIQASDNKLRKEALTEAPTYAQFIKACMAMESSKAQAEKMEEKTVDERVIMWINKNNILRIGLTHLDQSDHKIIRRVSTENVTIAIMIHAPATRKAEGKKCNQFKKKHYFAHAKIFPVNNVSDLSEEKSEESSESSEDEIGRIETVSHISEKEKSENYVEIEINGQSMKMKVDPGCSKVLIPGKEFQNICKTIRIVTTKVKLRPYGMSKLLDVIGRARVDMKNGNGQVVTEWVYVKRGQKGSEIEALLGSAAAKRMNILEIH